MEASSRFQLNGILIIWLVNEETAQFLKFSIVLNNDV